MADWRERYERKLTSIDDAVAPVAGAVESIRLCAALVRAQDAATRAFFAGR